MQTGLYWGALAALMGLLGWTIVSDIRHRRIPNWLTLAVTLLAPLYWAGQDVPFLKTMALQLAIAAGVALVFGLIWLRGWLGGGDLKLHVALALWLPLLPLVRMMVLMSLVGLILSLIVWGEHRMREKPGAPRIPYGVAIALATAIVLGEPIVNGLRS